MSVRRWPLLAACAVLVALAGCGPESTDSSPPSDGVPIQVTVEGPGRVTTDGLEFQCGEECTLRVPEGEEVALTAVPDGDNAFVAWTDGCAALANPCTLHAGGLRTVAVSFAPHALHLELAGDGVGAFEVAPPAVTCEESCGVGFDTPLLVGITYTGGADGTVLEGWDGDCDASTEGPRYCRVRIENETEVSKAWRHPPVADDNAYGTPEDTALEVSAEEGVLSNDDDTPGDPLTAALESDVTRGSVALEEDGSFTYTPPSGFDGRASFAYFATDAYGNESNVATVEITVSSTNDPPSAADDAYESDEDQSMVVAAGDGVLANDSDPDGDALTAVLVDGPENGELTLEENGTFAYAPDRDFNGSDGFTYRARDPFGETSGVATVEITVTAVNDAPSFSLPDATVVRPSQDVSGEVTVDDFATDIDAGAPDEAGQSLSFEVDRTGGSLAFDDDPQLSSDGTLTFDPSGTGTATFDVVLADDEGASSAATEIRITVRPELTVSTEGADGSVTSDPSGIDCGSDCSENFEPGASVTLTAQPRLGASFDQWSGGACDGSTDPECTVEMDADLNVTAHFETQVIPLEVTVSGDGTVTSDPSGIACDGGTCSTGFDYGETVNLVASAGTGSTFQGWGGDCNGASECELVMDEARSVTATFAANQFELTVSKQGNAEGTVTSDPGSIDCGTNCSATYDHGTSVTLTAIPNEGADFSGWSGDCDSTDGRECTLMIDGDEAVTASFSAQLIPLDVAVDGNGEGTVTSVPPGISCPGDCSATFEYGEQVELSAEPAQGSNFDGWSGACSGASCELVMDEAHSVGATFTLERYELSVVADGDGRVTSDPAGIACEADCSESYDYGTPVTLTATANDGSDFAAWSGDCESTAGNECNLTIDGTKSVTASFEAEQTTLAVTAEGPGRVDDDHNEINNCSRDTCEGTYAWGTDVTLTADVEQDANFQGWSGECLPDGLRCHLTMDDGKSVTATFVEQQNLALAFDGDGSGMVNLDPPDRDCTEPCTEAYASGTPVSLNAVANDGSEFAGWSGDGCDGSATTTCELTVDADLSLTAAFSLQAYELRVAREGGGEGSVASTPGGIACPDDCDDTFPHGTTVELDATAATGSTFDGWGQACSGSGTCELTMTSEADVSAAFSLKEYTLTVEKTGDGEGTVTSEPAGIACGDTCQTEFTYQTEVTLSAETGDDHTFEAWGGDCDPNDDPCVLDMTADRMATAEFASVDD